MAVWIPYLGINCNKCSDGQKALYGCEEKSTLGDWWEAGDYILDRCPLKIVKTEIYEYIRAYKRYSKGFLPSTGGWLEQSAKLNDMLDLIDNELAKIESKQAAKTKGGTK